MKRLIMIVFSITCLLSVSVGFSLPIGEEGIVTNINIIVQSSGCCTSERYYEITLDTGLKFSLSEWGFEKGFHPYVKIGDKIRIIQNDTGFWNYGVIDSIKILEGEKPWN